MNNFRRLSETHLPSEVMQLVLVTQYFDTLKTIGESDKTNTLFLSHSPGAVKDISDQGLAIHVDRGSGESLAPRVLNWLYFTRS